MNTRDIIGDYWWEIRKYRQSEQTDEDLKEILEFVANTCYQDGWTDRGLEEYPSV